MICKQIDWFSLVSILFIKFLNEPELIFFFCSQLNGFTYFIKHD